MGRASSAGAVESCREAARLVSGVNQRLSGASAEREGTTAVGCPGWKDEEQEAAKHAAAPPHPVWPTIMTMGIRMSAS